MAMSAKYDELRERHFKFDATGRTPHCFECHCPWPCEVISLLDDIEALRERETTQGIISLVDDIEALSRVAKWAAMSRHIWDDADGYHEFQEFRELADALDALPEVQHA